MPKPVTVYVNGKFLRRFRTFKRAVSFLAVWMKRLRAEGRSLQGNVAVVGGKGTGEYLEMDWFAGVAREV